MRHETTSRWKSLSFDKMLFVHRVNGDAACLISGRRFVTKCFLLDTLWRERDAISQAIEALMKACLLRLEGRELVDFLRPILVKLSRELSRAETLWRDRKNGGGKGRGERKRKRKRGREKSGGFLRAEAKMELVRSGCLRSTSFRDEQ